MDVVSLESYLELAALYRNASNAALMWGRKCIELEGGDPSDIDAEALAAIAESLRLPVAAVLSRGADRP